MISLAFYQPEIPQNTGTLLRLSACLGFRLDIIGPCGFIWSERRLRRAAMDYIDFANYTYHDNYVDFKTHKKDSRLIGLVSSNGIPHHEFTFAKNDILLLGTESCGLPTDVVNELDAKVSIPMRQCARSINAAIAASIVISEAMSKLSLWPLS